MKVAIVTDSAAALPADLAAQWKILSLIHI